MLGLLKKLFGGKTEAAPEAPYKVEQPVPAGDIAPQPVVETKVEAVQVPVEGAGTVDVPAKKPAKKSPAKKAAPKAAPAEKKPAAPKKPKAPKKSKA